MDSTHKCNLAVGGIGDELYEETLPLKRVAIIKRECTPSLSADIFYCLFDGLAHAKEFWLLDSGQDFSLWPTQLTQIKKSHLYSQFLVLTMEAAILPG